jgi:hypothetical protein
MHEHKHRSSLIAHHINAVGRQQINLPQHFTCHLRSLREARIEVVMISEEEGEEEDEDEDKK